MRCWMNQGTTMRFNSVEKDIEYCSQYGFEAIELKYNLICSLPQGTLKDLLQRYMVKVGSIGALQLPILQEKEVKFQMEKKLNAICQCAYALGAEHITVIPRRSTIDAEWGRIEEDVVKILERYCEIADQYNLKMAMEVMGFSDSYINTIEDGLKVIELTKKDNLGLIYDFYHVLGMKDLGKAILDVRPGKVYIVHVNDGMKCDAGKYFDDNRLWPGDGQIDIKNQMDMLMEIGYQGPFSIEVYQSRKWSYDIQECYRIARDKIIRMERFVCKGEQNDSSME